MIPAVSSQIPGPYQSFERELTAQKIVEVALIVIAALGIAAACLTLPPAEGLFVAMALGGFALIVAAAASAPAYSYFDPVYVRRDPPLPFYSRWFYPLPALGLRRPLFVRDPVPAPFPRFQTLRPSFGPSFGRGERIRVGGGHVFGSFSAAPFRQSGHLEGARVRVGGRR
jgi:hypothetical protein